MYAQLSFGPYRESWLALQLKYVPLNPTGADQSVISRLCLPPKCLHKTPLQAALNHGLICRLGDTILAYKLHRSCNKALARFPHPYQLTDMADRRRAPAMRVRIRPENADSDSYAWHDAPFLS